MALTSSRCSAVARLRCGVRISGRRQAADESKSSKDIQMNTFSISESIAPAYAQAFARTLSIDELRHSTPAVFAREASARTRPTYRFINTAEVLHALLEAGFIPSAAQQTRSRAGSDPSYARHMIRLRPVRESLTLVDCIPEICLINAHDGTSAYQLLAGLYRPLCTNGLLCRMGDFAVIRVPHRSSVVADVVAGALQVTAQFERIGKTVTSMAARILSRGEQLSFAETAFQIRWARIEGRPDFAPVKLLQPRRASDDHPTLWHTFNRLQQASLIGGIHYHSRSHRLVSTRRIRNIREDVRINTALWQSACRILES
jgi:hypothetical protein